MPHKKPLECAPLFMRGKGAVVQSPRNLPAISPKYKDDHAGDDHHNSKDQDNPRENGMHFCWAVDAAIK